MPTLAHAMVLLGARASRPPAHAHVPGFLDWCRRPTGLMPLLCVGTSPQDVTLSIIGCCDQHNLVKIESGLSTARGFLPDDVVDVRQPQVGQ